MGKTDHFGAQIFIEAIPGSGGIISTIAKRVGCAWHTAKKYIDKYPTITRVYLDECEGVLDLAESVVLKNIELAQVKQQGGEPGDTSDAKWYLSRKGKKRGYIERQEIEQSGLVTVKVVRGISTDDL